MNPADHTATADTVFLTICARNYLGFAGALGQSLREHHPLAKVVIWLLDEGPVEGMPGGVEVRYIQQLFGPGELAHLQLNYGVRELATAVKPACLSAHLDDGARHAIYIDPDILVFRPLDAALKLLDQGASGVLTPHTNAPLPRDGRRPDDLTLLAAGVYNLGFLALANDRQAREFLQWWGGWLRDHCFEDKSTGTFTDQKWVNFAPLFWPGFSLLRDSCYNVAYWNLPQRQLRQHDAEWQVDGSPLVFFHFSGFNPDQPSLLSTHQNRIEVAPFSDLGKLLKLYAQRLWQAGHANWRETRFPATCFDNGLALDDICRRLYREALTAGVRFSEPLLGTGAGSLFAWLSAPLRKNLEQPGKPRISRYMHQVYLLRADVMQAFPDLFGADREAFVDWLDNAGSSEMGLNPALRPQTAEPVTEDPARGVNYVGYLRSELGLGEAARGNINALERQGVAVQLVDVSHLSSSRRNDWRAQSGQESTRAADAHDVSIIHVNADQLFNVRDYLGPAFLGRAYNVGMWAWETPRFPRQWWDRFELLDEIWVGGSFMAESIAQVSPVPVIHVPHAIEVPAVPADRESFGLATEEFLLLFMFDFFSTPARKNPAVAIAAFAQAFSAKDSVRLVVKSMNGHHCPEAFSRLREQAEGLRVTFIDEALSSERRYQLLNSCDAFLSLHRAEGFGLGIAEAMAYGKPVVATGWSGNMDFMHVGNSFPVAYSMRALETADPPYEAGTLWAEPDLDHAAEMLRRVWVEREMSAAIGARAADDISAGFSPQRVGELMLERLEVIEVAARHRAAGRRPGADAVAVEAPLGALRQLLRWLWRGLWQLTPPRWQPSLRRRAIALKQRLGYR